MKYIILDLEWDGAYYPKIGRFINQILQIGAVKLDDGFNIIDTFDVTVKSSFTKRVSKRFAELTGITKEKMLAGISLDKAFEAYNDWVGHDAVTMTWSNSDIYTVLENEKNLLSGIKLRIEKYLDLQKYIQGEMRQRGIECTSQISLLNAANVFEIDIDEAELHNAKTDSTVCAMLLKKCYNAERLSAMIIDTSAPDFFARYAFKPYVIKSIDDVNLDKKQLIFACKKCGEQLALKGEWHYRNGALYAELYCDACGEKYFANIRARKLFDTVKIRRKLYAKRTEKAKSDDMSDMSAKV